MKRGLLLAPSGAFKQLLDIQALLEKLDLLASVMKYKSVKKNKKNNIVKGRNVSLKIRFFKDQLERKIKETVLNCLRSPASTVMNYNKKMYSYFRIQIITILVLDEKPRNSSHDKNCSWLQFTSNTDGKTLGTIFLSFFKR